MVQNNNMVSYLRQVKLDNQGKVPIQVQNWASKDAISVIKKNKLKPIFKQDKKSPLKDKGPSLENSEVRNISGLGPNYKGLMKIPVSKTVNVHSDTSTPRKSNKGYLDAIADQEAKMISMNSL